LASLALVIVAISVGVAFLGAWLAPPFAALYLLVVVFAFRNVERHAGDYERMIVRGDEVAIERWDRGSVTRFELNGTWVQVVFREPRSVESSRLALRSQTKWSSAPI